jgi:hypothetical protein
VDSKEGAFGTKNHLKLLKQVRDPESGEHLSKTKARQMEEEEALALYGTSIENLEVGYYQNAYGDNGEKDSENDSEEQEAGAEKGNVEEKKDGEKLNDSEANEDKESSREEENKEEEGNDNHEEVNNEGSPDEQSEEQTERSQADNAENPDDADTRFAAVTVIANEPSVSKNGRRALLTWQLAELQHTAAEVF